jgi:hypothetical protein
MRKILYLSALASVLFISVAPAVEEHAATVENSRSESDQTTVTLTAKADERLGIVLKPVEKKTIQRTRTFGGEVILPLSGGEGSIYALFPNMTPAEMVSVASLQIDADALLTKSKLDLDAALVTFKRADDLMKDNAGTERDVDDARAILQQAEAAVAAAKAKRDLLGSPIIDTVKQGKLWVRVPVYVGDLTRLQKDADAQIGGLADRPGTATLKGTPVKVPMSSGSAGAATVDLYFAVDAADKILQPGQRVGVTLPTTESGESLTVPWASVVTDINGGTWVYKSIAPLTYQRHRVQVRYVVGDDAAIATGPDIGTKVVVDGVAEVFGTEFGVGK